MLYVSKYNSEKGIYSVTDTDDGVTQHLSRERLLDVVHNLGVNVRGVTGDQIKVLVLKENSNKKPIQKFLAKAKMLGVDSWWRFDDTYSKVVEYVGPADVAEIQIPPVREIWQDCFKILKNTGVSYKVNMPGTVEVIGDRAFCVMQLLPGSSFDCSNLRHIGEDAFYNVEFGTSSYKPEDLCIFDMPKLKYLGQSAFENSDFIGVVNFGPFLQRIGDRAFCSCRSLSHVGFSGGLLSIGSFAFSECSLDGLALPKTLQTIGDGAFERALCGDIMNGSGVDSVNTPNSFSVVDTSGSMSSQLVLPDSILSMDDSYLKSDDSKESSRVDTSNFMDMGDGLVIVLPASLRMVGRGCFSKCHSVTGVVFDGKLLEEISYDMFYDSGLVSVRIPDGVTTIASAAFHNCTSLKSVYIPEGVKNIGGSCFSHCAIESIELPKSCNTIGDDCFSSCFRLKSVKMPAVRSIGNRAFYQCDELVDIAVPETCLSVGMSAFAISKTAIAKSTLEYSVTLYNQGAKRGNEWAVGRAVFGG